MNRTEFVGNLTRDPELRHSNDGKPRATFSLAINEKYGDKEETCFLNFVCFGSLAENVTESLGKGDRVVVIGKASTYKKTVLDDNGDERDLTMVSFIANSVGPELRWATAEVERNEYNGPSKSDDEEAEKPKTAKKAAKKRKPKPAPAATASDDDEEW